jgi:hypothetical protein
MILYEGPSELDGDNIVVIATEGTKNRKTGNMVQVWILKQSEDPLAANRSGNDFGICGNCPLKGKATGKDNGTASERACYVLLQNAPLAVWKKWKKCGYEKPRSIVKYGRGKSIRLGAYGDPAAIPSDIIEQLLRHASNWTGYTHQDSIAQEPARSFLRSKVMLSCETIEQAKDAWSNGARTFRMLSDITQKHDNEIICPATEEGGSRTNCNDCGLCKGSAITARSIVVLAHGNGAKHSLNVIQ